MHGLIWFLIVIAAVLVLGAALVWFFASTLEDDTEGY